VNSAVSRTTVAVLTVVQENNLTSNNGATNQVVNALNQLASTSTDSNQQSAVTQIAATLGAGGSIVDVIEEIEVVNSYASPA
jgi:type II secretory pathway component PulF